MPVEHPGQSIAEVAQQVPPIRDLDGFGRAAANRFGVSTGAVTRDDIDAGMVAQPSPDRLRLAVRQDIDGAVALEIDDERAVALPIAERSHGVMSAKLTGRQAQSSMPITCGVGGAGNGAVRISRSSVSPLTGMASRDARRAPASPPALKAMRRWASARRAMRRTRGRATPGRRSAKTRRGQSGAEHRKRRTCSSSWPTRPCHGRSPRRRAYRLWTRRDVRRHRGQEPAAPRVRTATRTRSGSTTTRSTMRPAGSRDSSDLDKEQATFRVG